MYFIVGIDAFLEINTWKNYQDLFGLSHFVVMDRPGYRRSHVKKFLQQEISSEIIFYPRENRFLLPWGFSVFLFPITLMDISSTRIRALRQKKQSIRYLVPYEVEDCIEEKNFYADCKTSFKVIRPGKGPVNSQDSPSKKTPGAPLARRREKLFLRRFLFDPERQLHPPDPGPGRSSERDLE